MRKIINAIRENLLKKIQQKNGDVSVWVTIDFENHEITRIEKGYGYYDGEEKKVDIDLLGLDDILAIYEEMYGTEEYA